MKTSTWTAQLTVASSKAQHYLNSLCTTPKRPPSTSKFYVDFKDQKIETHLLFLDVLRLVRHFFVLKYFRVRLFYLPRTHKRSSDGIFSSHPWFLIVESDSSAKSGQSWRNWDGWTVCWEIINTPKCKMQTFGSPQSVTSVSHSFPFPTSDELLYYSPCSRDVLFCFVLEVSRVVAS